MYGYECTVRHNRQESVWFKITSGVRQGCIVSPFLFLIVIDWMTNEVTNEGCRGLQWDMIKNLEDLDFADDITLMFHTFQHIQEKTPSMEREAAKLGLKINIRKTKIMTINNRMNDRVKVTGEELEEVKQFCYLGNTLTTNGDVLDEVKIRIGKTNAAFIKLRNIWKSNSVTNKTKIRIYRSNVRSVLLYGSETWKANKNIERNMRAFEGKVLEKHPKSTLVKHHHQQ